ncbi:MAG TPA: RNA polymerase sigma factor [Candidatus Sulfotelmatobacter sp.]|nr:RNA polymerase sigma factor [Candidatus Sulfotelmatobacter sp.]
MHRTTRNIAAETVRTDVRRRAREQEAAVMNDLLAPEPEALWETVAPHLDLALDELPEADRDAVLLRYFERQSAREMAQTLGVSEEAAQRRVSRAVERLRELFAKRGISVGSGGLVAVIAANAIAATPAGLAAGISAAALAGTAGGTATTLGLVKLITMTKLQAAVIGGIVVAAVVMPWVIHQQAKLRQENLALRQQIAHLKADNEDFSNQAGQLKISSPPRPTPDEGTASATQTRALTSYEQVEAFLAAHGRELPREQIEAYLRQNHRNLESLLAAFQVSRDSAYLREAVTNFPQAPAVQFTVIASQVFPEEQRRWIDAFKTASPDNALPWYFSALEYFNAKQPDQAIQELTQATRRQLYVDYAAQTGQAVEEMYAVAGWPALAAKAVAPGTASSSVSCLNVLKALANETVQAQQQYLSRSDAGSANSMASMGIALSDQLRRASAPIDALVGIAIEKKILAQLDPARDYDFLGRPVSEVLAEMERQKQSIRETLQIRDQVRPTLNESELNNYWEREKLYGETHALQWLQSKHPQP